ncbi:MAG TPA: methionyl-tRNA formyltransferase, partial [Actinomycetota bacterium]|nr:methionyl-tRNA formyltransferase [Actinomycetota bacterium]
SQDELRSLAPDVVAVVAFGQILPREVLEAPRLGCVNVHFSLLPRWRGAAPVERAIMAGDTETGITTMLMDEGLDTGPILATHVEPISAEDTSGALLERLAARGAEMLVDSVRRLAAGELEPRPQPEDGVTYARKITAEDTELDLTGGSTSLRDVVRALNPHPGAFTWFRGRRLKVLRAEVVEGTGPAGEIVSVQDGGPQVQTGSGRLELVEVQPEGKRPMSGADFVRGYKPQVGERLGVPR